LVARRYGQRPSQILELNPYEGYQLDQAIALKFHYLDEDNMEQRFRTLLASIQIIGKAFGVKYPRMRPYKPRYPKKKKQLDMNRVPTQEELFQQWGGGG